MSIINNMRDLLATQGLSRNQTIKILKPAIQDALLTKSEDKNEANENSKKRAENIANKVGNRQGTFVTIEALFTFPVCSTIIAVFWKLLGKFNTELSDSLLIPLLTAIFLGICMLFLDLSEKRQNPLSKRDIFAKSLIAAINTMFLAASAVGISVVI